MKLKTILALAMTGVAVSAMADKVWTGNGSDNNWSTLANWNEWDDNAHVQDPATNLPCAFGAEDVNFQTGNIVIDQNYTLGGAFVIDSSSFPSFSGGHKLTVNSGWGFGMFRSGVGGLDISGAGTEIELGSAKTACFRNSGTQQDITVRDGAKFTMGNLKIDSSNFPNNMKLSCSGANSRLDITRVVTKNENNISVGRDTHHYFEMDGADSFSWGWGYSGSKNHVHLKVLNGAWMAATKFSLVGAVGHFAITNASMQMAGLDSHAAGTTLDLNDAAIKTSGHLKLGTSSGKTATLNIGSSGCYLYASYDKCALQIGYSGAEAKTVTINMDLADDTTPTYNSEAFFWGRYRENSINCSAAFYGEAVQMNLDVSKLSNGDHRYPLVGAGGTGKLLAFTEPTVECTGRGSNRTTVTFAREGEIVYMDVNKASGMMLFLR